MDMSDTDEGISEEEEVAFKILEGMGGVDGLSSMAPETIPNLPPELKRMHEAATALLWEDGRIVFCPSPYFY